MFDSGREFVASLLKELDARSIAYVIARRPERLMNPSADDDIDFIVPADALEEVTGLVYELVRRHGGTCVASDNYLGHAQVAVLLTSQRPAPRLVRLDFQTSIAHHGVELVSNRVMLDGRQRESPYWRPRPEVEAVALLLHDLVSKARFRPTDILGICALRRQAPAEFRSLLAQAIGPSRAARIERALETGRVENLLSERRGIITYRALRGSGRMVGWHIRHGLRLLSLAFRRRGALAVVLGPDGSGKTTLIDAVVQGLGPLGFKSERVYFGATSPLLPTKRLLRWLRHGRRHEAEQAERRVQNRETSKTDLSYFLGTIHTMLDQWLRYWVLTRPKLARSRILLCDRYFYDALATPAPRGLKGVLDWLALKLTPRPDIVFVLTDSPEAIYARKPELSVAEIARQQRHYDRLLDGRLHARRIRVSPDPSVNADRIANEVLMAFGRRNG